jgi:hypothetical protein
LVFSRKNENEIIDSSHLGVDLISKTDTCIEGDIYVISPCTVVSRRKKMNEQHIVPINRRMDKHITAYSYIIIVIQWLKTMI